MCIDPAIAGVERFGDTLGSRKVGCPDTIGQTVVRVVGPFDSLAFRLEFAQVGDRSKNFFTRGNVVQWPRKQRGFHIIPLSAPLDLTGPAFKDKVGATLRALVQVSNNALPLFFIHDWTHLGATVQLIANLDPIQSNHTLVNELVIDVFMDQPTRGVTTNLACMEGDRFNKLLGRFRNVDIIKDDCGSLSTEFTFHGYEVTSTGFCNHPSDFWGARE